MQWWGPLASEKNALTYQQQRTHPIRYASLGIMSSAHLLFFSKEKMQRTITQCILEISFTSELRAGFQVFKCSAAWRNNQALADPPSGQVLESEEKIYYFSFRLVFTLRGVEHKSTVGPEKPFISSHPLQLKRPPTRFYFDSSSWSFVWQPPYDLTSCESRLSAQTSFKLHANNTDMRAAQKIRAAINVFSSETLSAITERSNDSWHS